MIRNGKEIPGGSTVTTEVCIIGSGPAGITAALRLQEQGIKVTLIEGSRDYGQYWKASWPDKKLLYDGVADGLFKTNESDFLIRPYAGSGKYPSERERMFGGTSTHWGGQCRPLDPITFENKRVGFASWPITRANLDSYYAKAATFCQLDSDFTAEYWAKIFNDNAPGSAEVPHLEGFDTEMYQFMDYNNANFATRQFDGTTIGDSAVDVILNASLLNIDHSNGVVGGLRVASMDDETPPKKAKEFTIKADVYVLACGAVANARQLLLSNAGNEHQQVGRHFMCHPLTIEPVISLSPDFLEGPRANLMRGAGWSCRKTGVQVRGKFSPTAERQAALQMGSCWFDVDAGGYYFEMAPNEKSFVTLAKTRDKVFDQWKTEITWELTEFDENTYEQTTKLFKTAVNNLGGEVSFAPWHSIKFAVNGHHLGTTRMSSKPEDGVVDANLKVHSLRNLYVAGASVFPSAGISNPTFTIVALSIRLAEHLGKALSS
jgi:choline dehydrogenase-like flavoprotein